MCNSARVAWKVVLYFSNRASICSHALILLSPTRWFVKTGGVQASVSSTVFSPASLTKHEGLWSLLFASIVSTLCFKHVWNVDPCLRTRIRFQHCVFSCFLGQTRLDCGSLLCTSINLHPCFNHILCSWSVYIISLQPFVSNTLILVSCWCILPPTPN